MYQTSDEERRETVDPWVCQNCTTKNENETQCVFCATYHLDASELNPLVTRLGAEPCPQLHGVTNAPERQKMFHSAVPMNSSEDDEPPGSTHNSPRSPMPSSLSSHAHNGGIRSTTKTSNRLKGFALPVTGYVYERECEKHRNYASKTNPFAVTNKHPSTSSSSSSSHPNDADPKKEISNDSSSNNGSESSEDEKEEDNNHNNNNNNNNTIDSDDDDDDDDEDDEMHPERPGRTRAIHSRLKSQGLLDRMEKIESRQARPDEVFQIHTKQHIHGIMHVSQELTKRAEREGKTHCHVTSAGDTYYCQDTARAALLSAGCLLNAVDKVVRGECQNAIANIRPPGHHAECDQVMGFCFFNNVAVAAKVALEKYEGVNRILIVDWDVHHGNATEHQFDHDPNVL